MKLDGFWKAHWKKTTAAFFVLGLALIGGAAAFERTGIDGDDCCGPGAPCCYPGSPCCARNAGHPNTPTP